MRHCRFKNVSCNLSLSNETLCRAKYRPSTGPRYQNEPHTPSVNSPQLLALDYNARRRMHAPVYDNVLHEVLGDMSLTTLYMVLTFLRPQPTSRNILTARLLGFGHRLSLVLMRAQPWEPFSPGRLWLELQPSRQRVPAKIHPLIHHRGANGRQLHPSRPCRMPL